ncbi:hypothetical protein V501_02440 [Pseudogymnoascus sp. VKM F-4519 (FW-2642)]|nr:hypothetical protein V501_02440 [Pseudogymnoascus sp. VKM F-4519 (FW-2642)]
MPDSPQATGVARPAEPVSEAPEAIAPAPEPKLPSRKDASLKEFLGKMDDYAPIIPDAVTNYYLTRAGLPPPPTTDPRLSRLLALATQKFVADIAADAYQYSRIRSSNSSSANNPMGNLVGAAGGASAAPVGAAEGKTQRAGGGALGVQRPGYGGGGQGGGQGRTVLTMEDLGMAVGEYGVNVKRGEFYRGSILIQGSPILQLQAAQAAAYNHPGPEAHPSRCVAPSSFSMFIASSRRCLVRLPGTAEGHNRHEATTRSRKDRDSAQRRPPRPVYRHQTDLDIGNPIYPPNLQRSNARRRPADRRPQGLERSNVQFHGEAPRLPNVRATAIFREPQNLHPDTLRQYVGSSGVPFEDPDITAFEESPIYSSADRRHRPRGRSNTRRHRPNASHPHDNGAFEYINKPLPPSPLRPHRATTNPTSTSRPPPAPSRSASQRHAQSSSEQQPDPRRSSSQHPPQPPNNERQLELWRSSIQRPTQSSNQQVGLGIYVPQSRPQDPSYHRGRPTDRELNRMSTEIETVESAWINAGRRSSQQQPVDRQSMGDALVAANASKFAFGSNQAIMHNL